MKSDVINENQEDAFDTLVEMGGEEHWVEATDVGHWNTVRALARRRVIQLQEFHGKEYVAVAGVLLEPPEESVSTEEEAEDGSS